MMLLGMIWAMLAPLGLVALFWLLSYLVRGLGRRRARVVAAGLVLVPVAAAWGYDRAEFSALCARESAAVVRSTARADGFLLGSATANSFGTRYLYDEGFAWFEAVDVYDRTKWVRYERTADGKIATRPIVSPEARYEVRETHAQPNSHTGLTIVTVIDRQSGAELARAASANFDGGRAKWVLGAWGASSCPSPLYGDRFQRFYHLARDTLRAP